MSSTTAPLTHGYAVPAATASNWDQPKCVCKSDEKARPGYSEMDASEYVDKDPVLLEKCKILKLMIESASSGAGVGASSAGAGQGGVVAYTGAGISTSAGIGDYASKASGSVVKKEGNANRLQLQPTATHRTMAAMEKAGYLHEWINQNHDGLAQKAGYPFAKLNEIHGGWFDKKNPVVLMDGTLRPDLYQRLKDWSSASSLVLAMGTSLCGMQADTVCHECFARHNSHGIGQGLVIINLQRTPLDDKASLRIYAKSDDVFKILTKLWKLKIDKESYSPYPPVIRRTLSTTATTTTTTNGAKKPTAGKKGAAAK